MESPYINCEIRHLETGIQELTSLDVRGLRKPDLLRGWRSIASTRYFQLSFLLFWTDFKSEDRIVPSCAPTPASNMNGKLKEQTTPSDIEARPAVAFPQWLTR
jgi:hypothetical protein